MDLQATLNPNFVPIRETATRNNATAPEQKVCPATECGWFFNVVTLRDLLCLCVIVTHSPHFRGVITLRFTGMETFFCSCALTSVRDQQ